MKHAALSIAGIVVAVCACTIAYLCAEHHNRAFPTFDDKDSASWHSYGGNWVLNDGVYTNRADGRGDKLVAGPQNLGDYSVSSDLRFDTPAGDPQFGDAGLLLRVLDPNVGVDAHRGYYAALRKDDHVLLIGAMSFYFRELATTPFPHEIRNGHWYHLTFTSRECTFHLRAEDPATQESAEVSYVERSCSPRQGQVGIRSYYAKASWRNLQVMPLPEHP